MSTVRDKLLRGAYINQLPPVNDHRDRQAWEAYIIENSRLESAFKNDALTEVGLLGPNFKHSKADRIWDKAWTSCCSLGYLAVLSELEELAALVK